MGLIRAAAGAIGGTMADQWLDFFYADALPSNVLVSKAQKRVTKRGSNNKGNENIISNGSGIAVADGQCMIIVEQGRIMDFCAEPGQYTWNQSSEPSLFTGNLGTSIIDTFKTMGRRFAHGGETGKDQRVYYFNVRELTGNKFGTATPIPFRVVDANIGLDIDITLRANGIYSFKISDPLLFYANVSGNVEHSFTTEQIEQQLKSEFLTALKPAFAHLSAIGMRYSAIPGHTQELCNAINEALTEKWTNLRGLQIVSVAINSLSAPKEDEDMIKELQRKAVMRNPGMAGAAIVDAQAEAMKAAASNQGGAMMGFMGLNMAQQAGGLNAQDLLMADQLQRAEASAGASPAHPPKPADSWTCSCGTQNTGRFCQDCGTPKPEPALSWTCACGSANTGKFCQNCGAKRPESTNWSCNCGTQNTGRFCQNCGTPRI